MATNNVQASAVAAPQQQVPPTSQNATSPPSKRDLASWWKTFKKNTRREEEKGQFTTSTLRTSSLPEAQVAEGRPKATILRARLCSFAKAFS